MTVPTPQEHVLRASVVIDYQNVHLIEIVRIRQPEVPALLAEQVVQVVHHIRTDREILKPPGVAETLDWARALTELGARELDTENAAASLGVAIKYREDADRVRDALDKLLGG